VLLCEGAINSGWGSKWEKFDDDGVGDYLDLWPIAKSFGLDPPVLSEPAGWKDYAIETADLGREVRSAGPGGKRQESAAGRRGDRPCGARRTPGALGRAARDGAAGASPAWQQHPQSKLAA
jgi:hypothetical protein